MINRTLGFTALGGFGICAVLFSLRFYNVVNPSQESAYRFFNLAFVLAFGMAIITSVAFIARWVFRLSQKMAKGFRWGLSIVSSVILFGFESFCFFVGCLGMNFMGQ